MVNHHHHQHTTASCPWECVGQESLLLCSQCWASSVVTDCDDLYCTLSSDCSASALWYETAAPNDVTWELFENQEELYSLSHWLTRGRVRKAKDISQYGEYWARIRDREWAIRKNIFQDGWGRVSSWWLDLVSVLELLIPMMIFPARELSRVTTRTTIRTFGWWWSYVVDA